MNPGKIRKIVRMRFLVLFLPALALAMPVLAQGDGGARTVTLVYAAKFNCGTTSRDDDVVRGVYATSINIHNPQLSEVVFDKRVVVANLEGDDPGQSSVRNTDALAPGGAMRLDCRVIAGLLTTSPPHLEGFVEIRVLEEEPIVFQTLDVVGKYTARPSHGEVSSLEVVVYNPTQLR
jgi:hypothetical protein